MKLFRAMGRAVRRWKLRRSAPRCPVCAARATLLEMNPTGKPVHFWECQECQIKWWGETTGKPVAYAHRKEQEERQRARGKEIFRRILQK